MATRTIPTAFPTFRTSEFNTFKPVSAELLRRLAQAQNYLWANLRRSHAMSAYDGLGEMVYPVSTPTDPEIKQTPFWWKGVLLCSFIVPTGIGASTRLKVQGRAFCAINDPSLAERRCVIGVVLVSLKGGATGVTSEVVLGAGAPANANGWKDWATTINVPQGTGDYECRIYASVMNANHANDSIQNRYVSARYEEGTAIEFGESPSQVWQPHLRLDLANSHAFSAVLGKTLARNTLTLRATRAPEICQAWLGSTRTASNSSYAVVGRYTFYVASPCRTVKFKMFVRATAYTGTTNKVRVLSRFGVTLWESAHIGAEGLIEGTFNVQAGFENTIEIAAKLDSGTPSANNYIEVLGVFMHESSINFADGTNLDPSMIPTVYQPVDESMIQFEDPIRRSSDSQNIRRGIMWLLLNDVWLAKHRTRTLVADWRNRIYKRYNVSDANSPYTGIQWDWTPGPPAATPYQVTRPKNTTLRGYISGANTRDGIPANPYGFSTQFPAFGYFADWPGPSTHDYPAGTHGRRLGYWWMNNEVGGSIMETAGSSVRYYVRARRLRPGGIIGWNWRGTRYPNIGPAAEEEKWVNRAWLEAHLHYPPGTPTSTTGSIWQNTIIPLTGTNGMPDHELCWYGPFNFPHTGMPTAQLQIHGRCPNPAGEGANDEGHYFEVELAACYAIDEPLNQSQLDALP